MMDFSFCALPGQSARDVVDMVKRAEDAGIPMVWVPDETFMRDPYVLLGAIAMNTSKIKLGVGIANPYTRHPIQIARAVSTIADLCGERVVLGIGAGLKPTRIAMGAPEGDFTEACRAAIVAMKAVMAGETYSVESDVFSMKDAHMEFTSKGPVDIYVATTHPRAFEMAGEVADGAIVGNVGRPDALRRIIEWTHNGARKAGRDPSELKIVAWNFALCGDDPTKLYDTIRRITGLTIANSHSEVTGMLGVSKEQVTSIRELMRSNPETIPADVVTNEMIDMIALVGDDGTVRERLKTLSDAGADIFGMRPSLEILENFDFEAMIHRVWHASA